MQNGFQEKCNMLNVLQQEQNIDSIVNIQFILILYIFHLHLFNLTFDNNSVIKIFHLNSSFFEFRPRP